MSRTDKEDARVSSMGGTSASVISSKEMRATFESKTSSESTVDSRFLNISRPPIPTRRTSSEDTAVCLPRTISSPGTSGLMVVPEVSFGL